MGRAKAGSEAKGGGGSSVQRAQKGTAAPKLTREKLAAIIARAKARTHVAALDGPPRRAFEVADVQPSEALQPVGVAGIPRDSKGLPRTEQNPELKPYKARGFGEDPGIYDDMVRTDGTAAGTVALMIRSISTAPADVRGPANPTPAEAAAVELTRRFFGLDGGQAWLRGGLARHVRQALRSLIYGFQPFEIVWRPHTWRGRPVLAPSGVYQRASRSVKGWVWDGDDLVGMQQALPRDSKESLPAWAEELGLTGAALGLGESKSVVIPSNRLLLYTYDPSGEADGAPEGTSILRPAYVWWKTKRDLILRYHMASDRLFGGVTLLQQLLDKEGVPMGSEEDLDTWADIYSQWDEGELGWLASPTGWKIDQSYPGFEVESPEAFLSYCDAQMRVIFAAQLLGGQTGAASEITAQMMYSSMDQIASWVAEVLNGQPDVPGTGLVRQLVDANIPEATTDERFRYPQLIFKAVEHRNFKSYVDSLMKLMQFFGITYTVETEQYLRELGDAPLLTPAQVQARRAFEAARLIATAKATDSQAGGGSQAPTTPPQQEPVDDPDGEDDAG
jgi:hypothetical protein